MEFNPNSEAARAMEAKARAADEAPPMTPTPTEIKIVEEEMNKTFSKSETPTFPSDNESPTSNPGLHKLPPTEGEDRIAA